MGKDGNRHLGSLVAGLLITGVTAGTGVLSLPWAIATGAGTAYAIEASYYKPLYSKN
mgnify:CR=1 FL=1